MRSRFWKTTIAVHVADSVEHTFIHMCKIAAYVVDVRSFNEDVRERIPSLIRSNAWFSESTLVC
jgi:hypothetical protein